jgi:hypothetical protein
MRSINLPTINHYRKPLINKFIQARSEAITNISQEFLASPFFFSFFLTDDDKRLEQVDCTIKNNEYYYPNEREMNVSDPLQFNSISAANTYA